MFEIQKSGDKTSSGEIGIDIRTHASPKVGQDQVSGGVSVLCWRLINALKIRFLSQTSTRYLIHYASVFVIVGFHLYFSSNYHRLLTYVFADKDPQSE